MNAWSETYLGLIFQIYALAFICLGAVVSVLPKPNNALFVFRHLNWLAGFGFLHGFLELIEGERLHNDANWLTIASSLLLTGSFCALFEFGRRGLNSISAAIRLPALPLYGMLTAVSAAFAINSNDPFAEIEFSLRYFAGAPGAFLASYVLLASRQDPAYSDKAEINIRWLVAGAAAFAVYGFLTLFVSTGLSLLPWLPTAQHFAEITGLPVQLPKALCAILIALSFAWLIRTTGRLTNDTLSRVLDTLNGFVYRCRNDRAWTLDFMTGGVEQLTGYSPEAFLPPRSLNYNELIHADDTERVWNEVQTAISKRREFEIDYRILTRNGEIRWVCEYGRGVFGRNGKLLFIEGRITDNTARRQAEAGLHIKNAAVDASITPIAIAGPDAKLSYVNPAFAELWHLPDTGSAIGRSALEFWKYPDESKAVIDNLSVKGQWQGDLIAKRFDGSTVEVQLSACMVNDADGAPLCMMASFLDISARKQAEQELLQERDFTNSLINTAPVIVLLLDPQGFILHVNRYFEELTGHRLHEIIGKEWFASFLPKRDRDRIRQIFRHAVHQEPAQGNINPIVIRNGEERDIEWHSEIMRDANGTISGLLCTGQDVTERRAIQQRAEMLQMLADASVQGIGWANLTGKVNYFNQALRRLLAVPENTEVGDYTFFDFYQEHQLVELKSRILPEVLQNEFWTGEFDITAIDGRVISTIHSIFLIKDSDGNPIAFANVITDLTERKRTEIELKRLNLELEQRVLERTAELERQSRRNTMIVDAAIDGFFTADLQGRIRDCNDTYCMMLGYTRDELLGLHIADIEAMETPKQLEAHIAQVIELGRDRFDTRHRRLDGTLLDVEVNVTLNELGGERLFFAFVSDISERKRSEAMLIAAREEAERANAAKSEFLSRMSHELRTPLNAILGFGQLLEADTEQPLTDMQADNLQEILQAGSHLLTLINEVLDLSRIESGRIELNLDVIAVGPLIQSCVKQIKPLAEQRGIAIRFESIDNCSVVADSTRLKQVLLNLLSNAVKYNRDGGRIAVDCMSAGPNRLRIGVKDTGYGISAESLPRLFKPFERLESAYQDIEGTGIGLALAKKLVESMHGEIGVDSTPGEGSRFWFELPSAVLLDTEAPTVPAKPPAINASNNIPSQCKLLYVEDNPANLRLVQKILAARQNMELFTAVNAMDGLAIAAHEHPNLILLDINLPNIDGFETLRRLKNNPATRDIPVIAVTANAMHSDIQRGMAAGFADYLTKPLDVLEFLECIDRFKPNADGKPHAL